ncbi:PAS domain S-box-containing protein [Evansella vedderi]|uniref:histidine kinase n=1 Tax=Evansella vedderi TaxID=38282 RepID=A0ABT9ZX25_9BACI|nr:response regulator [Evansella vedderi]MDQ0255784.1 PAS domain S-box-containing protein [Evansella vedderi]
MDNADKVNILIVDDRRENLIALQAVLDSEKYELIFAHSGEEALKYVLQYEFAVILMDVQMPGLSGFETAEIIKERESSKHIPIIFITAISKANEHVNNGYSKGAVDYIFKPFNPNVLKSKVAVFVDIFEKQKEIEGKHKKLQEETKELNEKYKNLEHIIDAKTKKLVETNEELKLSQEQFKKVFQFSPNLMAIRSLETRKYIIVNKSWTEFTGYSMDDLHGLNEQTIEIKPTTKGFISLNHTPLDLTDGLFNEKIKYKTKSNDIREGLLSTETSIINGEKCIISAITDVTEKQKLEKQIARLERLNLVGEMAAGIAHEIRNPMTTVLGFLQLTKNDENQSTTTKDYINLMIDELNRANSIITEYLSLAKDKATDKNLLNLNSVINALYPLLQAEALMGNKNVVLDLNGCPEIYIDEKEIRQLILNIGINGLEAMSETGKLTIRTYCEEEEVVLQIKDEGHGIKKELIENIGTPFFTTKDEGTGLGLAICFSIASRHGAEIDIDSCKSGTSFYIRFPLKSFIKSPLNLFEQH